MILVSIWSAKGEGRVSRDQEVRGDGKYKESMLAHYESKGLTAIQRRRRFL
jgi:hypothetical protein